MIGLIGSRLFAFHRFVDAKSARAFPFQNGAVGDLVEQIDERHTLNAGDEFQALAIAKRHDDVDSIFGGGTQSRHRYSSGSELLDQSA
jgi:hypothetical protein